MKETYPAAQPEIIRTDAESERKLGGNVLYLVNEVEPLMTGNGESRERPNGTVYAQDLPEYRQYASEATAIIRAAVSGDIDALDRIGDERFSTALAIRITSYDGSISSEEIEGMISVACTGLAQAEHGAMYDRAA